MSLQHFQLSPTPGLVGSSALKHFSLDRAAYYVIKVAPACPCKYVRKRIIIFSNNRLALQCNVKMARSLREKTNVRNP